ncbi:hypothetical protein GOP47_0003922 [Adiantum capillus-veneris]|uniref:Uncharacterized protein n=1 Tax=Adiantum capillus-veneris TaxID=13818 RepID=A0A9D4ZMC9_ADICA|nr:hypothetical protein GOP47_0003922 [Adiantum capillus-veneris]
MMAAARTCTFQSFGQTSLVNVRGECGVLLKAQKALLEWVSRHWNMSNRGMVKKQNGDPMCLDKSRIDNPKIFTTESVGNSSW